MWCILEQIFQCLLYWSQLASNLPYDTLLFPLACRPFQSYFTFLSFSTLPPCSHLLCLPLSIEHLSHISPSMPSYTFFISLVPPQLQYTFHLSLSEFKSDVSFPRYAHIGLRTTLQPVSKQSDGRRGREHFLCFWTFGWGTNRHLWEHILIT